jgi:hypothetical protein
VEIGGILLGSADVTLSSINIHDFLCIPGMAGSDEQYVLNTNELRRLRSQQVDSGSVHHASVIGYFRTQLHDTLELRETELDMVKRQFVVP